MCPGMAIKDLCQRFNPSKNGIDEQKLVKFGLMNGLIRRLQKFPINLSQSPVISNKDTISFFDGKHSYDQICCELHKSYAEVEDVEQNTSTVVCWK